MRRALAASPLRLPTIERKPEPAHIAKKAPRAASRKSDEECSYNRYLYRTANLAKTQFGAIPL